MIRKFIADEIGTDYTSWKGGDIVYITAPTGSGKTTFILNVLLPYVTMLCLTILLVVNRQSLRMQIKKELAYRKSIPYKTLDELDEITTFGNLTILTYQHMEQCIANTLNIPLYNIGVNKWFNYVVFDEAHYFIEDSMFNPRTELVYNAQRYHYKRAVRIFISATLDEFMEYNNEHESFSENGFGNCFYSRPKQTWEYSLPTDYSNYSVSYFNNFTEVCTRISLDKTDAKWIIFVSSIEKAAYINKLIDAKLISAATKNNTFSEEGQIYGQIVSEQKFDCKVIIATSVIDNGINLIDDELCNIVISTINQPEFMQMLGRKRSDGTPINLFIDAKSLSAINGYKALQINKMIEMIYEYRNSKFKVLKTMYDDPRLYLQFHSLFRFDGRDFKLNEIAAFKIFKINAFCKRIIERFKNEGSSAFIQEQLSWLGLEHTYSEKSWLDYDDNQAIITEIKLYLQDIVDQPLDKEQQIKLREYLTKQFANLYGYSEIDRISRTAGIIILNRILTSYGFKFTITNISIKRKTHWVIKYTEK